MFRYSNSQTGSMTALIVHHASEQARRHAKTIFRFTEGDAELAPS
jgi:hypothetical protein